MKNALPMDLQEFVDEANCKQIISDMLLMAQKQGATQAEVGFSKSVGLNVAVRMRNVETIEFNRDKSVGITVFVGNRKGSASTTDIDSKSLEKTVEAAMNLAKFTEEDPYAGLADPLLMAKENKILDLYHPWDLTVEQAIALGKRCEQSALDFDKKIVNSEGATVHSAQNYYVYGNSHGFIGSFPSSRHTISCVVIAEDLKGMERDHDYTISRQASLLESVEKIGESSAVKTLKRLNAKKLATQKIPVLFDAAIASGLISQFIAAISGGRLFRKSTFLLDSLGKKVFPEHIHIYENPHIKGGLASAWFDHDGLATQKKDFVKEGVVQNYVLSTYSARKLNLQSTANAGGVHNLFIEPGNDNFPALLKKMNKGLLVTELMGQGINLVTGDYSRGATGFWVENGEIQFPVHEMTIAANLKDMFLNLVAVGNDVDPRHNIQTGSLLIEEMMVAGN